jgi:hypothetical protein
MISILCSSFLGSWLLLLQAGTASLGVLHVGFRLHVSLGLHGLFWFSFPLASRNLCVCVVAFLLLVSWC